MKRTMFLLFSLAAAAVVMAANTVTRVTQVADGVTVSDNVDYTITSATPFATAGSVNISNTDHAVLIIKGVKPSVVKSKWLAGHVFVNGEQAKDGVNCQVKMYAGGTIIMPYAKDIKPLTVYSGQDFGGTAVNDFGLEHSGGFMNTLTADKLNNQIRSFKLKRGYMVTFSTRAQGRGYSRCFIADTEDLEVAVLPAILDQRISSYRVFQWYDAQKKALADNLDVNTNAMLGTTSSYTWGTGESRLPDMECISNHIHEAWPSPAACGSVNYTCHMKTNNEPANPADDNPATVAQVLANWEDLMRTGLRLCSPSTHDGGWGWHDEFMKEIDARGWRCDIADFHGYWNDGVWNSLDWRIDRYAYGRPVWISEWIWGASWNNDGIFSAAPDGPGSFSTANQQVNSDHVMNIVDRLENTARIERYFYWNGENVCSRLVHNGQLSIAGKNYAALESNMAYRKAGEFIPKTPPQQDPANLKVSYDDGMQEVTLKWDEYNGEYNQSMIIQVKKPGGSWQKLQDVDQKETEGKYTVTTTGLDGYQYRIQIKDLNGTTRNSNEVVAVNGELTIGGSVSVGENRMFLGGNMLLNGDFSLGLADWQDGAGAPLAAPYYQAIPKDGADGGAFLQCYGGNSSNTSPQSIFRVIEGKPGECYYVSMSGRNTTSSQKIYTTRKHGYTTYSKVAMSDVTNWDTKASAFELTESKSDTLICINLTNLAGKAQIDEVMVARLFPTRAEALADAREKAVARINLFKQLHPQYGALTAELDALVGSDDADAFVLSDAVTTALQAINAYASVDSLRADATMLAECSYPGAESLTAALEAFETLTAAQGIVDAAAAMKQQLAAILQYSTNTTAIQSPSFAGSTTTGWNTKAGTYTEGDQRANTVSGHTCWNAWWSISAEGGASKTMEINQTVTGLAPGFYALECKAGTQHLCETDQHAFITTKNTTVKSQPLQLGLLDIPTFAEAKQWETLVTPYIYIGESDTVTIGFRGSKDGAVDKQWMRYESPTSTGDNREGWWCATDFKLRHVPMLRREAGEGGWGTVCLPRAFTTNEGVKLYKVAGITTDSMRICVEEETEPVVAGRPYIFRCGKKGDVATFYLDMESAEVKTTKTYNGLRGTINANTKYLSNYLVLKDGYWVCLPTYAASERPLAGIYTAYFASKPITNLTNLDSWQGEYIFTKDYAPCTYGDADGDGAITMADANMIVNYYLGAPTPGLRLSAADMDFDGTITMSDANAVVNLYLGSE